MKIMKEKENKTEGVIEENIYQEKSFEEIDYKEITRGEMLILVSVLFIVFFSVISACYFLLNFIMQIINLND